MDGEGLSTIDCHQTWSRREGSLAQVELLTVDFVLPKFSNVRGFAIGFLTQEVSEPISEFSESWDVVTIEVEEAKERFNASLIRGCRHIKDGLDVCRVWGPTELGEDVS